MELQDDRIVVKCTCGAKMGMKAMAIGHNAQCPKCRSSFVVPEGGGQVRESSPAGEPEAAPAPSYSPPKKKERYHACCPCGERLRVPAAADGRKARCPACHQVFRVRVDELHQEEEEATVDESSLLPPEEYGLVAEAGDLSALADGEALGGGPATATVTTKYCANCHMPMPGEARVCDTCGYDTKKGRVKGERRERKSRLSDESRDRMQIFGGFFVGVVCSGVGAIIGGAIWLVVAAIADREFGYVAWAVGLLAGYGMRIGFKDQSVLAGVIAAVMAALGIIAAKVLLVVFIFWQALSGAASGLGSDAPIDAEMAEFEVSLDRERLAMHRADRRAADIGLPSWHDMREEIHEEEMRACEALSTQELEQEIAKLDQWEEGGKWADEAYIREFLVYHQVDKALGMGEFYELADEDEPFELPTQAEWDEAWQDASSWYDGISTQERRDEVNRIRAEREAELAEMQREAVMAIGRASFPLLMWWMFGGLRFIFFLLAVATAFGIAHGGGG